MALNFGNRSNGNNNQSGNDESWKSDGFINLYLPGKNGAKRKLGAIGLKADKPSEKDLFAWLKEDPERVAQLIPHLTATFQLVEGSESSGFDVTALAKTGT